jgi:hypothetical protein
MKLTCIKLQCVLFFSLFYFSCANAQQFINGSLEPAVPMKICSYDNLSGFNTSMGNAWMLGGDPHQFVVYDTCGFGSPSKGHYFVGMLYEGSAGNVLLLKLDAPMSAGVEYAFVFDERQVPLWTGHSFDYGYSYDSTTQGPKAGTIGGTSDSNWVTVGGKLTPTAAAQYIWVAPASGGASPSTTFVDNFTMWPVSVNSVSMVNAIHVQPNPFTNAAQISIDATMPLQLPYKMEVYDVTGRSVWKNELVDKAKAIIRRDDIGSGMFFLKITDRANNTYCTKIVAQ